MWKSNALGILTQDLLNSYLDQYYAQAATWPSLVTSAFPGYYDIYKEAGVGPSYGYLDRLNGFTFSSTLQQALIHHPNVIQIATWNDYGEGTIIEPTGEFGYQYLEIVQAIRDSLDSAFQFQTEDLQLPLRIYNMRLKFSGNDGMNSVLDRVFNFIITSQRTSAVQLMDSLSIATGTKQNEINVPEVFVLQQNYPNPFNPSTVICYQLPKEENVSLTIFNTLGQRVATLVDEDKEGRNVSSKVDASTVKRGILLPVVCRRINGNEEAYLVEVLPDAPHDTSIISAPGFFSGCGERNPVQK